MPKASVTRLIERDKVKLINFVLDIEKYPEFIPFCIDSKVYEKKEDDDVVNIIADLTIGKKPFVDTYKSDVKYIKNQDLICLLYTSPSPRDRSVSRMPSSA